MVAFQRDGASATSARREPQQIFRPPQARRRSEIQTWVLHTYVPVPSALATITVSFGLGSAGSHDCGVAVQGLVSSVASS